LYVYEHLTATDIGRDRDSPEHAMYCEGFAMRQAIQEDLKKLAQVELVEDSTQAEAVIVIAPETGGLLEQISSYWDRQGVWRLGPSIDTIRLTTDKQALAEHWQQFGVPTPPVHRGRPRSDDHYPLVWKPRDGCGSQATFALSSWTQAVQVLTCAETDGLDMIVQPYVDGQAVSVAFLCGPNSRIPLQPTFQHLSTDGRLRYLGGSLPLPLELARRAVALGQRALAGLSGLVGYIGVDLVLGKAADGSEDYAIEINPRFTTSYVGLRVACRDNLAAVLLEIARGGHAKSLNWRSDCIVFEANGRWQRLPQTKLYDELRPEDHLQ
jgi:predicted ATP-grasp superfamily ATP-dependent carboligase